VPSAQVSVVGTSHGTLSDNDGRFRIGGLSGTSVTLEVRRIGYKLATQPARVGATDVRILMSPSAVNLSSVVVTGTTAATSKRELGMSVAQINASEVVKTQPVQNLQGLINGRAPGVTMLANSGAVGSGSTVRIRGGSSLALANTPLIYVDGVRVNNAQSTGPSNQAFGASTTTRWNDFNPDDIESIEIVRGPAATALYGTQAVNGVIQIITKRGAQGAPRWEATVRRGVNQFANAADRLPINYDIVNGEVKGLNVTARRDSLGRPIWRDGDVQNYNLAVSGGTSSVRYRLSGNRDIQNGVEPSNAQRSYGARGSVVLNVNPRLDITANTGLQKGNTTLPCEAGCGGALFSAYYGRVTNIGTLRDGFGSGLPEAYWTNYKYGQDFTRFTGSVEIAHRPTDWLNQRLIVGNDIARETNQSLAGVHHDLSFFFGNEADSGFVDVQARDNALTTLNYNATASWSPMKGITTKTTFGTDLTHNNFTFNESYGENFPAPGLSAVSSTTAKKDALGYTRENTAVGIFGQEEVAIGEKLYLTGGLRTDQNSQFGKQFKHVVYPHLQAAYVLSDEPFFKVPGISQLKLRAAYGQSGQAPPEFSVTPIYDATVTGVVPSSIGNPGLKPERGVETELGFDLSVLHDRAGVEFTYYDGSTQDAIVQRTVAPSSGYPGTQYINAGKFTRKGMEVALRATPYQRGRQSLDLQFAVSHNDTKVRNLGGDTFLQVGTGVRNQVGYPAFSWFTRRVVAATLDPKGAVVAGSVQCDDGKGGQMACASAPEVYIGRTLPNVEGAFNAGLRFLGSFRIASQIDFKQGYRKVNGNDRVRCWTRHICYENAFPLTADPVLLGSQSLGSGNLYDGEIQDASYTKLRELSLTYELPQLVARRLGASGLSLTIAGRNLKTWTPYKGLEPEASFQAASAARGGGQWEQATLPQLRSFVTTFNVSF
jgi:TonB-linked SusC/RagA family outer membrane protein